MKNCSTTKALIQYTNSKGLPVKGCLKSYMHDGNSSKNGGGDNNQGARARARGAKNCLKYKASRILKAS